MNWIMQIAPTIATALGGPLAGAAAEFLASKLGASDKTVEGIQQTLSGMTGADLVKLKELDLDFDELSDKEKENVSEIVELCEGISEDYWMYKRNIGPDEYVKLLKQKRLL